ncbi:MAG: aminoacyl-tRNA hydrolase [Thermodesulfovibrionia bacterium]
MWLIAGLGNPGEEYEWTRHNIGFIIVDELSRRFNIPLRYKTKAYIYGKGDIDGIPVILLKPLTFMNRSGSAIMAVLDRFREIDDILIIHDDLDLNLGVMRIKRGGSSGGHRGVESIIQSIGNADFVRLRIGIGRSRRLSPERYVLTPFSKRERTMVELVVDDAITAVSTIMSKGISYAQNVFHKKKDLLIHST